MARAGGRDLMSHEFCFELLLEEIPAWMLETRLAALRDDLLSLLNGALESSSATLEIDATSRRIAFALTGLPKVTCDREEEIKGPPRKIAFEADGTAAKALAGFLRKNNARLEDVIADEGDYVRVRRTVSGRSVREILSVEIPRIVETLRWPKMMRWGTGAHAYIRPVHSVVSLFDGELLPMEIFGVSAANTTVGHRTLSSGTFEVTGWRDLQDRLAKAHVVLRAEDRIATMRSRAAALAQEVGGRPADDATIWSQWKYLTEAPGLVRAEFPEEYLELPEEVLVTVMRVHQKQLPVLRDGRLTSSFLAVIDQAGDPDGNAASGNAFVTNARFADARFFYRTDRSRPLSTRVADLEHLQFHDKLGHYASKADRLSRIAKGICLATGREAKHAEQAASLAKTDLVTEMVKEFTELQGKIGGIYAREEGHPEAIWQAVYDHYLPVNAEDPLPRGETGAIVSLADRIDTLAGFFSLGLRPSGSKDPFALRRAAQGLVQILLNRASWEIAIGVDTLITLALDAYGITANREQIAADLSGFIGERTRTLLEEAPFNFAYDEIAAAMDAGWTHSLTDLTSRTEALRSVRSEPDFLSILDSARRIANITQDQPSSSVDGSLLHEPAEQRLASLAGLAGEQIDELIEARDYAAALASFAGLSGELETFFDEVMVMVDDEALRMNRKALLRRVGGLVGRIAEVTRIVVDRRDYGTGS